jgi:hypothetical protein
MVNPQPHFLLHLLGSFLAGYVHRQAAQQQRWADPMLGDDDFGILAHHQALAQGQIAKLLTQVGHRQLDDQSFPVINPSIGFSAPVRPL